MNHYLLYARVIKEIDSRKGNFKSVIFNMKKAKHIPENKFSQVYRVTLHINKNLKILKQAVNLLQEFKKVDISNRYLFIVLLNEYFFGKYKEIRGGGKLKRLIKENESFLREKLLIKEGEQSTIPNLLVKGKVYLRFKNPIDEVLLTQILVKAIEGEGKENVIGSKKQEDVDLYKRDQHIPNLLQLEYNVYSKALPLLKQHPEFSEFTIQGKSSCFPVFILLDKVKILKQRFPERSFRFDVIDACAAPGNKTIQISEYLGNDGRVFAFEKDAGRAATLKSRVEEKGITNVRVFNKDFLSVDPNHKLFKRVRFIVADPSCSGTGMLNQIFLENEVPKNITDAESFQQFCETQYAELDERGKNRINKLSEFQKSIVLHCLKFPSLIRMTYSTCSLYEKENEDVVAQVIKSFDGKVELLNTFTKWKTRGFVTEDLEKGKKCVRANPFVDETDGFFVSLLQKRKKPKLGD